MRVSRRQRLRTALTFATAAFVTCVASATTAEAVLPPTTEEAQEALSRFAVGLVARLADAKQTAALTPGKIAEINEFAHRQPLQGCDDRRLPDADPFAPAPKPDEPPAPVVFHCTWASGERISLTRVANTGSWIVSDDATAAEGAGMILTGPRLEGPKVVAIPVAQLKDAAAEEPAVEQAKAVASYPVTRQSVFVGASMEAMPSPFIPQTAAPTRPPITNAGPAGPMPTPFIAGR